MIQKQTTPEQLAFDSKYITVSEILDYLSITRPQLTRGMQHGRIGSPIVVNDVLYIWERETALPQLNKWLKRLELWREE